MSEDNCLNCIFFDKNNRWCDISDPKEYQEDYELEATWCNCYERTNEQFENIEIIEKNKED